MWKQYLIPAAAGLFAATPLAAQGTTSHFEGRWTIVAVAEDGHCEEKVYRLPIAVKDGAIRYAGLFAVDTDGRIDSAGRLTMTLVHDGDVVNVQGRLGSQTGKGKWVSPGCAGAWKARKSYRPTSSR